MGEEKKVMLSGIQPSGDLHLGKSLGDFDLTLKPLAQRDILRVFEPHEPVTFDELKASLAQIRRLWA